MRVGRCQAIFPIGVYVLNIYCSRPVGQAVKTPPFHGGNTGSNPVRVTIWRISSAGRAPALQAGGRRFDPVILHHSILINGPVVQLVRMPACHAGGRGFESRPDRNLNVQRKKSFEHFLICYKIIIVKK